MVINKIKQLTIALSLLVVAILLSAFTAVPLGKVADFLSGGLTGCSHLFLSYTCNAGVLWIAGFYIGLFFWLSFMATVSKFINSALVGVVTVSMLIPLLSSLRLLGVALLYVVLGYGLGRVSLLIKKRG